MGKGFLRLFVGSPEKTAFWLRRAKRLLPPGQTLLDGYSLFAVRFLATIAASVATYKLVEGPFRKGCFESRAGVRFSCRSEVWSSALVLLMTVGR